MTGTAMHASARNLPDRWPTEIPLFMAVVLAAAMIWLLLIVSIFGILYAVLIGFFFFASHVAFVAHLRGSGVRLGPDQFPGLHRRIIELAAGMDMEAPDAYLVQAGGTLNAFATRFLGRDIVVLYSDLLEACGDNNQARDMIIAHELAHLRCGHLRWTWLTLPGLLVPFLGSALSRAREYTCDRFGRAAAGGPAGATLGLAILSAGPRYGPEVNLRAFVDQRADTNTAFMTLGEWLATHPSLSKRVAVLEPALADGWYSPARGRILAVALIASILVGSGGLMAGAAVVGANIWGSVGPRAGAATSGAGGASVNDADAQVDQDLQLISAFIEREWGADGPPASMAQVRERWNGAFGDQSFPTDPYDGLDYGYDLTDGAFRLWSSGPDRAPGTADDISLVSSRR